MEGIPVAYLTFVIMNRFRIVFIISLVSLALLTLVGVQMYWIRSAIQVEESQFLRTVNEAAASIAFKLQKIEVARQYKLQKQTDRLLRSFDSLNQQYYIQMLDDSLRRAFVMAENERFKSPSGANEPTKKEADSIQEHASTTNSNTAMITTQPTNPVLQGYRRQHEMLSEMFAEIVRSRDPQNFEVRYESHLLDSVIGAELRNKGIRTEYEFGIFNPALNKLVVEKTGEFPKELMQSGLIYPLAPDQLFSAPDHLVLYFPNQMKFVLQELTGMLGISVLIVLILVGSFIYAIATIIKQRKISELKTDFINNMTHEFKTPISTVALACEALNDKEINKSEDLYRTYIGIISEENKRLGAMAEKILQTAILEKGDLKLRLEPFDLHEVVQEVVKTMSILVEIRDGHITTSLQATQPIIQADRVHITNILNNLIENANKYTPAKPEIRISTTNTADGLMIMLQDNGVGISKTNQKKIFDKLYRVPTGNIHNVKGYGLGLSYVKFIVEKHHGSISVESEPGQGSVFKILLPFETKNHS